MHVQGRFARDGPPKEAQTVSTSVQDPISLSRFITLFFSPASPET